MEEAIAALGGALIGGLMALLGTVMTNSLKTRRDNFDILRIKLESTNDLLNEYQDWIGLYQSHLFGGKEPYRSSPINKLTFSVELYFPLACEHMKNLRTAHDAYESSYFAVLAGQMKGEGEHGKEALSMFLQGREALKEAAEALRNRIITEGTRLLTKIRANE